MLGLAALLTALSACGTADNPTSLPGITPASPEVAPGENVQFTAPVAPAVQVAWAVREPDGGTIDNSGIYTAPLSEGLYTVTASFTSLSTATQVRVKRNVRVDVSPNTATVAAGESLALSAAVTGAVKTVTWSLAEGTAGGTITAAGVYTAPGTAGIYDVLATSTADPMQSDSATITVTAALPVPPPPTSVTIAVSPQTASIVAGNTVQFTASVGGSTDTSATWSVAESAGGTMSAAGLYIAPATAGSYHVVATSHADPSKTASATVTVTAPVAIAVSPQSASVIAGRTVQFTATISGTMNTGATWSVLESGGGTVSASGLYTAPSAPGTYHVEATSIADSTQTRTATVTVTSPPTPGVVLAFPGCQGSGCATPGGRGGTIYKVTNLADSGTGSLRACVQASGPRTCVFTVGGHITLHSTLAITNPYITIAGQTAPGGGIELSGQDTAGNTTLNYDLVQIATHDVVIRYVKMRLGSVTNPSYANSLVVQSGNQYNIVVDHCTLMWGSWDNLSIYATGTGSNHDQTYSWNILAEPLLQPGATGSVTVNCSGANSTIADASTNIDMHHNLITSGDHRNPTMRTASGRLVNNVVYNYNYYAMKAKGNWDIVGNYFKPGPMNWAPPHEIETWTSADGNNTSFTPKLFLSGNAGPHNSYAPNPSADLQLTAYSASGDGGESSSPLSTTYQRATPLATAASGVPIVADSATTLADSNGAFLATVGAAQGLDCSGRWISNRDSVDARVVNEFKTATGTSNKALSTISGYPSLAGGSACADSDGDGMPDAYEIAHGLNPNANDASLVAADGYTNLEHYLSGL